MSDVNDPCLACGLIAGEVRPAGGILWRGGGLTVHAPVEPPPIAGWAVLTSDRHARALDDLTPAELAGLGPLAARVMRAQRLALGAEHVYGFAIGDALRHFHLHLVPRFADTPARLRGRGCFDGSSDDALPSWKLVAAAEALRRALASTQ